MDELTGSTGSAFEAAVEEIAARLLKAGVPADSFAFARGRDEDSNPFQEEPPCFSASQNSGNPRLSVGFRDTGVCKGFYDALCAASHRPDDRYAFLHEQLLARSVAAPGEVCWLGPTELSQARQGAPINAQCGWCKSHGDCWPITWRWNPVAYCAACWESCVRWAFEDVECLCGVVPREAPSVASPRLRSLLPTGFVAISAFREGRRPRGENNGAMVYVVGPRAWENRLSRIEFLSILLATGRAVTSALSGFNARRPMHSRIECCRVHPFCAAKHAHPGISGAGSAAATLLGLLDRHDQTSSPRYELSSGDGAFPQAWDLISRAWSERGVCRSLASAGPERLPLERIRFLHDTAPDTWAAAADALDAPDLGSSQHPRAALVKAVERVRVLAGIAAAPVNTYALDAAAEAMWPDGADKSAQSMRSVVQFLTHHVRSLPRLFADGLPVLRRGEERTVLLSRRQCAALLAATIFGVVPKQDFGPRGEWESLPTFDVSGLLAHEGSVQQMMCMLSYFEELSRAGAPFLDGEFVSFSRRMVPAELGADGPEFWSGPGAQRRPLGSFAVVQGLIEEAEGALQADFANRYVGGGVLDGGLAQEEIRFLVSPECIPSCLFVERMLDDEAVVIVGALQYSKYRGYWEDFEFAGRCDPRGDRQLDDAGRRHVHIVAFDALSWTRRVRSDQYTAPYVRRELLKAYAACLGDPRDETRKPPRPLATGNWGCGAFKGDPQLKALVQWLAASMAGRPVLYHPYGDDRVARLAEVVGRVEGRGLSCSQLYALICGCPPDRGVFDEVLLRLEGLH